MIIRDGVSYYTSKGHFTGPLKYWPLAGYFTSSLLKNRRWKKDGSEINSVRGWHSTQPEPYDIVREANDRETKEESAAAKV